MACLEIRGGNRRESYSVELPGLSAWISCRPLPPASTGGDLHYLTVCSKGAISRVALADVAGHGEVVSSVADRLRDGLRKHVDTWDQSILLQELNNAFLAGADGVQFATAFVLGHYVQSGEIVFTNAGHVPPLWYRAAECKWLTISDSTPYATEINDLPLGVIAGTPYRQTAIRLSPGDLLVLYTDGLTESQNSVGQLLGSERFATLASTVPVEVPGKVGEALFAQVEMFRSHTPAFDDETMIVLRRNGR